jgi:sugar/nucleoside kinase (ribokinase family)
VEAGVAVIQDEEMSGMNQANKSEVDVVGIGALNLDYIVNIRRADQGNDGLPGLTEHLVQLFAAHSTNFEWGTELIADEQTVHAALEAVNTASVDVSLGGSAFNAVLALARMRLDIRIGYVGVAGRTPLLGLSSRQTFADFAIDDSFVHYDDSRLSGVCLSIIDKGERTLCTHVGANAGAGDFLRSRRQELALYLSRAKIIHLTSFLDDLSTKELLGLLTEVRKINPAIIISLDPGHVWVANMTPEIDGLVAISNYLLLNYKEFKILGLSSPADTDETIADRVLGRLADSRAVVIVKRSHGILNFRYDGGKVRSDIVPQTPLPAEEINDSTGAGDVFAAGVLAALTSTRLHIELGSVLGMALARHKLRYVGTHGHSEFAQITRSVVRSFDTGPDRASTRGIFIAHGRDPQWLAVKEFIDIECRLPTLAFNSGAWSGKAVTEALSRYLEQCSYAVCVLTIEDTRGGNREWARQNVIHEVGLFQGRYGMHRVVLLVEEGCGFVPIAPAEQVVHFPRGAIESTFWRVRRAIRIQFNYADSAGRKTL